MAVMYSQNGVVVRNASKKIVPISATTDIVVVDKNGYIGEKRPNGDTVYFGYLDAFADYSQAGLGQVTIIPSD